MSQGQRDHETRRRACRKRAAHRSRRRLAASKSIADRLGYLGLAGGRYILRESEDGGCGRTPPRARQRLLPRLKQREGQPAPIWPQGMLEFALPPEQCSTSHPYVLAYLPVPRIRPAYRLI